MNNIQKITEFVQWTHKYNPLIYMVRDPRTSYYGYFWIQDSNENPEGKYMTVEELYNFWEQNPDWVENVVKPRLQL